MTIPQDNNLVSIIVRTNQEKRLPLLKNALMSIIKNDYRPIEIIIVAQSEQQYFIEKLEDICQEFTTDHVQTKLVINRTSQDERAKNLNLGINAASGRYIGFLDDDDIFYSHHLKIIISSLEKQPENFAWSYTDVLVPFCSIENNNNITILSSKCLYKKEQFSISEFFQNNFIPIHTYLLDKTKIDPKLLKFDESLKVMEDYAFLLKIAKYYQPLYIPEITCEYRFWADSSNTNYHVNMLTGKNYKAKLKTWNEAESKIEILKLQLDPNYKSTNLVSFKTRQKFVTHYPYLYILKYKFPKIWKFLVTITVKLKLIK